MPKRVVTFGRQPTTAPPGNFREVIFPNLASLDQGTNEGFISRILNSDGADTRSLPRTISFQEMDTFGHDNAAAAGSIWELSVDGETGILSGKGWFADDEWGRKAAFAVMSKKLHHNSIDLAEVEEVEVTEHGDFWDDDFKVDIEFKKWKFGKTTLVAVPAFADAHAVTVDEMTAALDEFDGPLVVECPSNFSAHTATEMVAGMEALPSWDHFHRPESDIPHKIILGDKDADGWIPMFGNLGKWDTPHTGYDGQKKYIPRSRDNYATFCQPSVLTDKGMVNTGPVVLFGGHVSLKEAADDPVNAWADVRVTDGKHGPWVCGVVRPHIAEDLAKTYIARASRLSGHWKGDTLRMIVSVNAEGFPIEADNSLGEDQLVAGFVTDPPAGLLSFSTLTDVDQESAREWVLSVLGDKFNSTSMNISNPTEIAVEFDDDEFSPELVDTSGLALEVALALEEDLG